MSDCTFQSPRTYIAECDCGLGLFAGEAISAGAEILQFNGPELTLRQVRAKGDRACDALQIGIDRYLDLQDPGRLVNHSCQPNAGVWEGSRLIALRALQQGDEIRFDYSTTIGDGWTMPCRCGSDECRELVVAYHLLPHALKQEYALRGLVQRFLLEDIGA